MVRGPKGFFVGRVVLAFWRKSVLARVGALGQFWQLGKFGQIFEEGLLFGTGACNIVYRLVRGGGFDSRSALTFDAVRRLALKIDKKLLQDAFNCSYL